MRTKVLQHSRLDSFSETLKAKKTGPTFLRVQ